METPTGIIVAWKNAGWWRFNTEVQVADDSGGSPDLATVRSAIAAPRVEELSFPFPLDDTLRHFRVRHIGDGYDPSAWTIWVAAKPADLTESPVAPQIVRAAATFESDELVLEVVLGANVESIKYATSAASFPDPRTGTAVDTTPGSAVTINTGVTSAFGAVVYVTLTPYSGDSGTGISGEPLRVRTVPGWPRRFREPTGYEDMSVNGDFEEGLAFWGDASGSGGSYSLETASPDTGVNSLKLTNDGAVFAAAFQVESPEDVNKTATIAERMKVRVQPGDRLRMRATGKVDAGKTLILRVQRWNENKGNAGAATIVTWTETSFTNKEGIWEVGAGTYYVSIYIQLSNTGGAGSGYIDEIHMWRVKRVPDVWFDEDLDFKAGSSPHIADTETVVVGQKGALSSISKTIRIPYGQMLPRFDSGWRLDSYAHPKTAASNIQFDGSVVLPKGVTVTGFRVRTYRQNTGDFAEAKLFRSDDSAALTTLATLTHATTGWATLADTSLNDAVGNDVYYINVSLTVAGGGADFDARFLWTEIDYDMPSYDKGY